MFEAQITINIPGLVSALDKLSAALLDGRTTASAAAKPEAALPTTQMQPSAATPYVSASAMAPAAPYAPAPAQATPPVVPAVPVTPAPAFTHVQVGNAGAELIAASPAKMGELLALLGQFGVQAITELKPDQLGPFATALRGLGARI